MAPVRVNNMALLQLEDVKAWLRISYDDDDDVLAGVIDAAEGYVAEIGVALAAPVPAALQQALLLLIGHWWENREAVIDGAYRKLPLGFEALITPYREIKI